MRSTRGSESSRYKILFIITVLLIATLGVLYVLKWQEAATLSQTLEETQMEVRDTQGALDHKVTELQQQLENELAKIQQVQSQLKECREQVSMLEADSSASEKSLSKCEEEVKNLQAAKESVELQVKDLSSENEQFKKEVEELQMGSEKASACQQQLEDCHSSQSECLKGTESMRAKLKLCTQKCPGALSGVMTSDSFGRQLPVRDMQPRIPPQRKPDEPELLENGEPNVQNPDPQLADNPEDFK